MGLPFLAGRSATRSPTSIFLYLCANTDSRYLPHFHLACKVVTGLFSRYSAMQKLSEMDSNFLQQESTRTPMHISPVLIYDQSARPGGKVRLRRIALNGGQLAQIW